MSKSRLEAFSDGVIAIIITIMVLELKAPHADSLASLRPLLPALFAYVLSFIYVGIYWNNHHHMLHAARHVSGMTLWANLHLLFWLSLIPFVTNWIGETHFATWPVAAYGFVLLMAAMAWSILSTLLVRTHGRDSALARALGRERKEWVSIALYIAGIVVAIAIPAAAAESPESHPINWGGIAGGAIFALVAAMWFIPDRRIERALAHNSD